jgi:hypothetical protein
MESTSESIGEGITSQVVAVDVAEVDPPDVVASGLRHRRRKRSDGGGGDRPCRRCSHVDCMMDRGEAVPDWIRAYQDGVRYHDAQTRARAREEAAGVVDRRLGYAIEFAPDRAAHALEYDAEELRILTAWDAESDVSAGRASSGADL